MKGFLQSFGPLLILLMFLLLAVIPQCAAMRLQVLSEQQQKPDRIVELGLAIFAIDPFQAEAHLRTVTAAESLGQTDVALSRLTSLLQLQPDDSARLHFRIATLLKVADPPVSRRHVLLALERAPRFREAHRLLLELASEPTRQTP